MPAHRSSDKEKGMKKEAKPPDSDLRAMLEQMKLKNDALIKIYEFFEKKRNNNLNQSK